MKNNFLWSIAALIIIVALIVVFYYEFLLPQPQISLSIKIIPAQVDVYPYQLIYARINITNTGTTEFRGIDFGVTYNGSLMNIYNISLPAGKSTSINFSKEAIAPGSYQLSVAADPTNTFNINRSSSKTSVIFDVFPAQLPRPYNEIPNNNTKEKLYFMDGGAYVITTYLNQEYGLSLFRISSIPAINAFLTPVLNLTYTYLQSTYSAEGTYKNNTIYSLWLQGPITQNIFSEAAKGANLSTYNYTFKNLSSVYVKLDTNTTLCSWYSGGWTKILGVMGTANCKNMLYNSTKNNTINLTSKNPLLYLGSNDMIANMTTISRIGNSYGKLFVLNKSFVLESERPNFGGSTVCYGLVNVINNVSYCSNYLFSKSNRLGPISLIDTKAYIGQYNISVLALINTSAVTQQVEQSIGILNELKLNGTSESFTSGISSSCTFNASLGCFSPSFGVNGIILKLHNNLNQTFKINSMTCYVSGTSSYDYINRSILPSENYSISVPCYNNGNLITGVSLGLYLNLKMNYSVRNTNYNATGHAYIV